MDAPAASSAGNGMAAGRCSLRLYITGQASTSAFAVRNLERIAGLVEDVDVEVIDVRERPDLAEEDRVLATPTLIKREPPPVRKIIGDLSDPARVLLTLDLAASHTGGEG